MNRNIKNLITIKHSKLYICLITTLLHQMTSTLVFEAEIYSKIERGYEKWLLLFKMLKFVNISI